MSLPVGVFDSGLGGLTVVRAIRDRLPGLQLVYLGDTARVPYGTRSADTVRRYARACADRLMREGVERIVIACNTVSAVAVEELESHVSVPIHDVVRPGAAAGVAATRSGHMGVLATLGTIESGAYQREIVRLRRDAKVTGVPAPLLVSLAEEGWTEGEVPELAAARYIAALVDTEIDTLVLGCTHYPLLRRAIDRSVAQHLGAGVTVVDSAEATAAALEQALRNEPSDVSARAADATHGSLRVMVTDLPTRFEVVAARFLGGAGDAPLRAELVDL